MGRRDGPDVRQTHGGLEQRLEEGAIVTLAPCPFTLPSQDELAFLYEQKVGGLGHKNISYAAGRVTGHERHSQEQATTLTRILGEFAERAQNWLAGQLPGYARNWRPDRVSYRPEEEATRKIRLTARNDLLHVDAFPSRPTQGARILRLFVNIHPSEPRVWATSDDFASLLERYGAVLGYHQDVMRQWAWKMGQGLLRILGGPGEARSEYDHFMLRLHHFLKGNEEYQEQARKKFWHFPPGSAWLAFTDGFCHAELRGRFALEQTYFVSPEALTLPDRSPAVMFARASRSATDARAA